MQDLSSTTGLEPEFLPWEHRVFIVIYLFGGCFPSLLLLGPFFLPVIGAGGDYPLVAEHGLPIAVACPVAEPGLWGTQVQ